MNPLGFQAYMGAAQEHSVKAFDHVAQLAKQNGPAVPLETLLVEDVAAHKGILQAAAAQGADLIIIGSHGRSDLERFFLGGTANKVSSHAKQPVLIVR
jgi:nucleotide-binding universal stress UspA family protein